MPYVEATGAKLYFEESGYGYPIIFIHEFASDIRGWESQLRHLSRGYRCIAYNARGYPPSDVPEDASLYRWQLAVDDIAAVMRDLKIERAHLVGLSMGGYAALQFGLRYPEKASAIVAASVGSGSHPSQRDAWLRETSVLARIFIEHGMVSMSERMARGPARIQLKYKDQKSWREFIVRLRQHSALGMSNTMARCQALRPSLHDLQHQFSEIAVFHRVPRLYRPQLRRPRRRRRIGQSFGRGMCARLSVETGGSNCSRAIGRYGYGFVVSLALILHSGEIVNSSPRLQQR
jgi:pimeloyl-ACP methyl ester carboxylesterase